MNQNNQENCVRCRNPVKVAKSGTQCKKCGIISHNSCLNTRKNVTFFKDGTVICCKDISETTDSEKISLSQPVTADEKTSDKEIPYNGESSSSAIDKVTIKYLEELIKQKDLTINNQNIAIQALTDQVLLLKREIQFSTALPLQVMENQVPIADDPGNSSKPVFKNDFSAALHTTHSRLICQNVIGLGQHPSVSVRKPNERNILVGTGQNSTNCPFKAAKINENSAKYRYYHATKFDPDTNGDELNKYLKNYAPNLKVEKLNSRRPDLYASFLISVPENESGSILTSEIWPDSVVLNLFRFSKNRANSGNSTNSGNTNRSVRAEESVDKNQS